ncbi:MAG: AAA family ATPase [Dehalococcoidia bacterium]|nr:AAA family ATPase [Dehalococcoidia bacterium]
MMEQKNLKLAVKNFGPIREGEVEFKPLTVFIGPNNSGKSYMATLLYALLQALIGGSGLPNVPLRLLSSDIPAEEIEGLTEWAWEILSDSNNTNDKSVHSIHPVLKGYLDHTSKILPRKREPRRARR